MALIYDISMLIEQEMPVYKNKEEKRPSLIMVRTHNSGKIQESRLEIDLHCGTHVDAPLHAQARGASVERLDPITFLRGCKVLDLTEVAEQITAEELSNKDVAAGDFILLKTRNSYRNTFEPDFVYLERSGALYLAEKGVVGLGIDGLGVERDQPEYDTHQALFSARIAIIEGLRLAHVTEGEYILVALPLKIKGAEASPVRAVLIKPEKQNNDGFTCIDRSLIKFYN